MNDIHGLVVRNGLIFCNPCNQRIMQITTSATELCLTCSRCKRSWARQRLPEDDALNILLGREVEPGN